MRTFFFLSLSFFFISLNVLSQDTTKTEWWNPAENEFEVINGKGWPLAADSPYQRFPEHAKDVVRKTVWNLSKHSSGLKIRFRSNAKEIVIRYGVTREFAMQHMPATGVSGVDLYAKDSDGKWMWCRGNAAFKDTINITYKNLTPGEKYHNLGREYHLYLPLYNEVKWMQIGVDEQSYFEPIPVRKEKPIVVYGTSIAQGACASRPGMAWTAILERKMDRPLINLGFSGNGKLESEVIQLLTGIDAKIFILDCLPNLTNTNEFPLEEVYNRILSSVQMLRQNSSAPVLLVEHAGYSNASSDNKILAITNRLNSTMRKAFEQLLSDGVMNIFLLSQEEISLGLESYVDGVHPSDLGMMEYANAYEKKIREILKEPTGNTSTTLPVTQAREPHMYNWEKRHNALLELNKKNPPGICFFGNSITHYWGGIPKATQSNGATSWNNYFKDLRIQNFGFGWDRIENVLWRIQHDELDGFQAESIVLMLGTNNLHLNSDEEIINGMKLLLQKIQEKQPNSRLIVLGIYPRRDKEERIVGLNRKYSQLAKALKADYYDVGPVLLKGNGKINESLFLDGLHPNSKGYNKLAPLIQKILID